MALKQVERQYYDYEWVVVVLENKDQTSIVSIREWEDKDWKKKWQESMISWTQRTNEGIIETFNREIWEEVWIKKEKITDRTKLWILELIVYKLNQEIKSVLLTVYTARLNTDDDSLDISNNNWEIMSVTRKPVKEIREEYLTWNNIRPWMKEVIQMYLWQDHSKTIHVQWWEIYIPTNDEKYITS